LQTVHFLVFNFFVRQIQHSLPKFKEQFGKTFEVLFFEIIFLHAVLNDKHLGIHIK